jgi:hypothetical protein
MAMKVAIGLLIALVCTVSACVPVKPVAGPPGMPGAAGPPPDIEFGQPCSRARADDWEAGATTDPRDAFQGAACLAYLAEQEQQDVGARLSAARTGRELAETAVAAWPDSGLAHYLLAYLTGLVAEKTPLKGLELVPVIEGEAQSAARLKPDIDHGGPDRMLGELYLRAPGFPVSIGDPALAVVHYRRAVTIDPVFAANRLGLIEALLAEEETTAACKELKELFRCCVQVPAGDATWVKVQELQQRMCEQLDRP